MDRDGGMLLFAVDGKRNAFAVFECGCADHVRRDNAGRASVGTNHALGAGGREASDERLASSQRRFRRLRALTDKLCRREGSVSVPHDLIRMLADPGVEVRGEDYGTVYANVACPSERAIWYTFGGYPAASAGAWRRWPWALPCS